MTARSNKLLVMANARIRRKILFSDDTSASARGEGFRQILGLRANQFGRISPAKWAGLNYQFRLIRHDNGAMLL